MPKKKKNRGWIIAIVFIGLALATVTAFNIYDWWLERKASMARYKEFGISVPAGYAIHGIDVSRYQQVIDWEEVKKMEVAGVKIGFVFIKATEGETDEDILFRKNWKRTKEINIPRGAYHYFLPQKDALVQALNFLDIVSLKKGDLPPVLDVEDRYGVTPEVLRAKIMTWLIKVEKETGIRPMIYSNVDFYEKYLSGYFDEYPFWAAHYFHPGKPRVSRNWHFWQHSEGGRVNGIIPKVDFNVFNGDTTDFNNLLVK
ncbi:MAG: glycoside hydrolase family 25 protein [Sphingobacteriales bacterium]|nr:glycoside hydrolase family 25 protein [Sphingobacteriales bacterium]